MVGHVVPEAQVGGPIALVQDGDVISIDAVANTISMDVSDAEILRRKEGWVAPPLKVSQGTLLKYARLVTDASRGCSELNHASAEQRRVLIRCSQQSPMPSTSTAYRGHAAMHMRIYVQSYN